MPASSQLPTILHRLESIFFLLLNPHKSYTSYVDCDSTSFLLFMEYLGAFPLPSYMECSCHNFLYQEHVVLYGAHSFHGSSLPSLWPPPPGWSLAVQLQTWGFSWLLFGFGTIVSWSLFSHLLVHSLILLEYSFWLFPKKKCMGGELFEFTGVWMFL